MLPKEERLKERRLFNIAFKKKQVLRNKLISLYYLYSRNKEDSLKAAFIVGIKVNKSACKRNLIKRRMRSIHKKLKDKVSGINAIIWICNPNSNEATFKELEEAMLNLVAKLKSNTIKKAKEHVTI